MKDQELQYLFSLIESASTVADLQVAAQNVGIVNALKQKAQKYPRFSYQFGDGIQNLHSTFDFEKGLLKNENPSDLEKLLYAVSWKQGDVRKIKYVFEGLTTTSEDPPPKGQTFWYFGRFLRDPVKNPIIDRNVVLAFATFKVYGDLERLRKITTLSLKELVIIQGFIRWYRRDINESLRSIRESRELLDDLLFCAGQSQRKIR